MPANVAHIDINDNFALVDDNPSESDASEKDELT
jgi:hypothetical protein